MLNKRRFLEPWSDMTRETRDALFMLVVIACTCLPLMGHVPFGVSLTTALLLVWKGHDIARHKALPGRVLMSLLLMGCIGVAWLSHQTLIGRDAGVSLVVMLLTLKTLEIKARRDAWALFFLAFFVMLTNFFYSQSLLTAMTMLLATWGWMTVLVLTHRPVGRPALAKVAWAAGKLCLLGTPMMLALFMLFPRLAPLWGTPGDGLSRTGLSGQMRVGQVAKLALDDSVALRVRWLSSDSHASDRTMPPRSALYFRGPVLTLFDGERWFASNRTSRNSSAARILADGQPWAYEVMLEPHRENWLLTLDGTASAPQVQGYATQLRTDMQWALDRPVSDAIRYTAKSHLNYRYDYETSAPRLDDALTLPFGYNPRTLRWAQDIRRDPQYREADAKTLSELLMSHLSAGGYRYTLEPGTFGPNAADEFWFDRKLGFCEHFASSFVLMMRALKVPARVVTGFQGGEINPLDGLWTVRNSDAHAWAEVWDERAGWIRIDPTSAVSPLRLVQLQRLQAQPGPVAAMVSGALGNLPVQWLGSWRSAWEALNTRWNHYVINYTQGRQLDLLRHLGLSAPGWQDLLQILGGLLLISSATAMFMLRWQRQRQEPWAALLNDARQRLTRAGLSCLPSHSPRQMAKMIEAKWGSDGQAVAQWLMRYEAARYAPEDVHEVSVPSSARVSTIKQRQLAQLQRELKQLVWPRLKP